MRFTYTYRSSDGQRHTGEIEAESRDAAFARVRTELGIKPIKVVAEVEGESRQDGGSPYGRDKRDRSRGMLWGAAILAAIMLVVLGGAVWWMRRPNREPQAANGELPTKPQDQTITVVTPQGPVTLRVAEPLPRQAIPGNRQRIEDGRNSIFTNAAERLLARFAEPGRAVAAPEDEKPTEADFAVCLREPIRLASNELTEHIDLKRIVTGMKREMNAYLAGGGTVDGYLAELEKRQKLEVSYRERAEQRLNDMLNGQDARSPSATGGTPAPANGQDARGRDSLKAAYAYWLKANAQLQAMGIYPLALPDALRSYQMSLDIEE